MPRNPQRRYAAYHEAGHAVARACIGRPSLPVEIHDNGTGLTHGNAETLEVTQYEVWDELVFALAGDFAEARLRHRSPFALHLAGHGRDGWNDAQRHFAWLTAHGYAPSHEAAEHRAIEHTRIFLREHWDDHCSPGRSAARTWASQRSGVADWSRCLLRRQRLTPILDPIPPRRRATTCDECDAI